MTEREHKHWWATLAGLIAAIAALITALATLIPVVAPALASWGWLTPLEVKEAPAPVPPQAERKTVDTAPPKSRTIDLNRAFAGFSCDVSSYGTGWAEAARRRISSDLYQMYGCSVPPESHMKPGYRGDFHTNSAEEQAWSGFASRSTVLYYSAMNRGAANIVASDLSIRYRHKFVSAQGGGQGVLPDWFDRTIIVHLRESEK